MCSFYKQFDELYLTIANFLNEYCRSEILQNYFIGVLKSFFYGNLVNNFFTNLNRNSVKEFDLPRGRIGQINREFKCLRKNIKSALSLKFVKIDEDFYNNFKTRVSKKFPEFQRLIQEIEKMIDIRKAKKYLEKKVKKIKAQGNLERDFNLWFMTIILESYIQNQKSLPLGRKLDKFVRIATKKIVPEVSQELMKTLKTNSKEMLDEKRRYQTQFENRLYERWKEPLDLLECLIEISLESAMELQNKLSKIKNIQNKFQNYALLRIHARSVQISNEILVLLKTGFADGANSRWRSLHELAVISFFLKDNDDNVSKRYLDHDVIRRSKEAKDYQACYKKLGYLPISRKELNQIEREKKKLCTKYGDKFQSSYGWIPSAILSDRNFRALETVVKLDKLHPFYNLSCDSVHGGAKGFYRLGLMTDMQDKVLLVGPSNYGLADPIQNTATSLAHTTVCLLNLRPDFNTIIQMQIIIGFVREICRKAVSVQKSIENEETSITLATE